MSTTGMVYTVYQTISPAPGSTIHVASEVASRRKEADRGALQALLFNDIWIEITPGMTAFEIEAAYWKKLNAPQAVQR